MEKNSPRWGIINKMVVPIQLYPKIDSEMADEGLLGMIVKILEDVGDGWYYIETHYNYNGYIHESNMIMDESKVEEWRNSANYVITHGIVDVMTGPTYKSHVTELLTRGATVILTGNENEGWSEIQLPDSRKGWVRSFFVGNVITTADLANEESLRKSIIDTAMSYIGTQYRWGGKSPFGIDCSGLCSIAYLLNGVIIYRDALLKDEYMREICMEEMRPADLLFFPGHVAMYIGDDRFIHSSGSINGVNINSLNPEHSDYRGDLADSILGIGTIF